MSEKFTPEAEPIQSREERIKKLREKFSQFSRELDQAIDSKKGKFSRASFYQFDYHEPEGTDEIARIRVGSIHEYGADPGEPVDIDWAIGGEIIIKEKDGELTYELSGEIGDQEELEAKLKEMLARKRL